MRRPGRSRRPRRHAQFPALRQDPTELALANVRQAARRSDHVLKHPAASAGRCASGRRLRGCRAWYLRRRPRQRHSRKRVVRGFPSPWPPANAAAPGRMAFRPRDPAHKVAARPPDRLVWPVPSCTSHCRTGQENIGRSIAAGRDACIVMPTGGGKSLCHQFPAVLDAQRTVVVVSPLIALMQDQVAQLEQMGIPAGFLNSSLSSEQRSVILRRASEGHYRLLYLSPERIALDGTAAWLGRLPVSFFAIDEAHCISEWGHDFRPEYRQLSRVRELFPDRPIAAFTASATQRVRHDIIEQLRLRDPYKHIASFRRANLRYVVRQCDSKTQNERLLRAVKQISDGSIIVYAPTIARVGDTVDFLEENGIAAIGYHGQMESAARRENQEKWMADEVRVMVGTMAFGLGINKAAVRAVIHLSLPKSAEQYYQDARLAGRSAVPPDCFLFLQKKDTGLHAFFILENEEPAEKPPALRHHYRS